MKYCQDTVSKQHLCSYLSFPSSLEPHPDSRLFKFWPCQTANATSTGEYYKKKRISETKPHCSGRYLENWPATIEGPRHGHAVTVGGNGSEGGTSCVICKLHRHCVQDRHRVSIQLLRKAESGNLCRSWHRVLRPEGSRVFP